MTRSPPPMASAPFGLGKRFPVTRLRSSKVPSAYAKATTVRTTLTGIAASPANRRENERHGRKGDRRHKARSDQDSAHREESSATLAAFDQVLRSSSLFVPSRGPVPTGDEEADESYRKGRDIHCEKDSPHAWKQRNCQRRIPRITGFARDGITHDGLERPSDRRRGK